ncbi:hypothetical protein SLE2022_092080 [Rubroshorea leprosula]
MGNNEAGRNTRRSRGDPFVFKSLLSHEIQRSQYLTFSLMRIPFSSPLEFSKSGRKISTFSHPFLKILKNRLGRES